MKNRYKLSFVAGGLLLPETTAVSRRLLELPDWNQIKAEVDAGLLLRTTRVSSRQRYFQEIRRRFRVVRPFEVEFLAADTESSRLANFVLCCRYYEFVSEFMIQVVRDKMSLRDTLLGNVDFFSFFERLAGEHPELRGISESTRIKVRTVLYRMLSEVGFLDPKTKTLSILHVPESLVKAYQNAGDSDALAHLLVGEGR